jgi:hypothetical protein
LKPLINRSSRRCRFAIIFIKLPFSQVVGTSPSNTPFIV